MLMRRFMSIKPGERSKHVIILDNRTGIAAVS